MEKLLLEYLSDAVIIGDFTLTSGRKSDFYIDVKKLLCNSTFLYYLKSVLYDRIYHIYGNSIDCIGGMELGSVPISSVVAEYSATQEYQYNQLIIRKQPKSHGISSRIIFSEIPTKPILLVDDVLTTGGSLYTSYNILIANQIDVIGGITIVDREEDNKECPPVPIYSLFKKSDLLGYRNDYKDKNRS